MTGRPSGDPRLSSSIERTPSGLGVVRGINTYLTARTPAKRSSQISGAVEALADCQLAGGVAVGYTANSFNGAIVWCTAAGHAASLLYSLITRSPSLNCTPLMTWPSCRKPRSRFQDFSAPVPILQLIDNIVFRVTQPLVRELRCRIVANADSTAFVVRRCTQCLAGKS